MPCKTKHKQVLTDMQGKPKPENKEMLTAMKNRLKRRKLTT